MDCCRFLHYIIKCSGFTQIHKETFSRIKTDWCEADCKVPIRQTKSLYYIRYPHLLIELPYFMKIFESRWIWHIHCMLHVLGLINASVIKANVLYVDVALRAFAVLLSQTLSIHLCIWIQAGIKDVEEKTGLQWWCLIIKLCPNPAGSQKMHPPLLPLSCTAWYL